MDNYLPTLNPFGLAGPPPFFLKLLKEADPQLVLFPSMEEPVYCLARRVVHGAPLALKLLQTKHPNAHFCCANRLLAIVGVLPDAHWGPLLIADLQKMDMWRAGGSDKFCDSLEKLEEEKRNKQDLLTADEGDQRSVSAWHALKLRQGSTTFVQGYSAPTS